MRSALLHECLDHRSDPDSGEWRVAHSGAIPRQEIRSLLTDVNHHLQRLSDLAYDGVQLELAGCE